ncbi:hypothetical protein CEXT_419281 [Caerostris extrusa]|uniref:C2H2-type domain-containing protein n=1 Tax=Caerostris extrusa TaxID=172846 RepID=A0AAV4MJY8_CAEEX|nr:hypothetical protein CEXT_419281 [Caerostris extrusa]
MEEASYKTDEISDSENNSCKMIQSNIFTDSPECSSSALKSSNNSKNQEKRHVCGVCQKAFSRSSALTSHKRFTLLRDRTCATLAQKPFTERII